MEDKNISWLKVTFPIEAHTPPVIFKIWWSEEVRRDELIEGFKNNFDYQLEGMKYELLDEDEGRRESGKIVMATHVRWEDMIERRFLIPTFQLIGAEN